MDIVDHILSVKDDYIRGKLTTLERAGFHLSGSRLFHCFDPTVIKVSADTDWDFCGEYAPEAVDFLTGLGFEVSTPLDDEYTDDSARMVMSLYTEMDNGVIQVVLRRDVDAFMSMIYSVSPHFYRDVLWKSGPNGPMRETIRDTINQLLAVHTAGQQYVLTHNAVRHPIR